jgi:hypothetical protein
MSDEYISDKRRLLLPIFGLKKFPCTFNDRVDRELLHENCAVVAVYLPSQVVLIALDCYSSVRLLLFSSQLTTSPQLNTLQPTTRSKKKRMCSQLYPA